jgi:arginyl-tRNA synthetase
MVRQALVALGYSEQAEKLKHVSYGVVSLSPDTARKLGVDTSDGKTSYPMSGRQGIGIRVTDFLDRMERSIEAKRSRRTGLSSRAIAAAAMRYYLLKFHLQTEVVFDLEQATEITGNTGVYLLYSYARSRSILHKAGADSTADVVPVIRELEEQELQLIRHLAYWPDVFQKAIRELAPNLICTYAYEIATLFNHFYATCPVLKVEPPKREIRLWLTKRFRDVLQDALDILGMPAPKSM